MSKVVYPPLAVYEPHPMLVDVFLAGSIEMGKAEDWQTQVGDELSQLECVRHIFNPRRDGWDVTQVQSIDNQYFADQVNWELDNIENSKVVFMYFQPGTMSPITLAELGYVLGRLQAVQSYQQEPYLIVCCPDGFWRQGNVNIMCHRSGIPMYKDLDEAIKALKGRVWTMHKTLATWRGYAPFQSPWENNRETKLYENHRGQKLPKNFQNE